MIPYVINLSAKEKTLNESFIAQFAGAVKLLLRHLFPPEPPDPFLDLRREAQETQDLSAPRVKIVGTPQQVEVFTTALKSEKDYMQNYIDLGLTDEKTLESKYTLNRAVERFEKETDLLWPFK